MSARVAIANTAGVIVAVGLALAAAAYRTPAPRTEAAPTPDAPVEIVSLSDGRRALRDATGTLVELRPYQHIMSASILTDRLLHELAEPQRVVGVTTFNRAGSPWAYQQADKPALAGLDDLEAVLALRPDLVVTNGIGDTARIARLRERGIAVFDLGEMRGAASLIGDIHAVAYLLGHPERGVRYATAWQRRFDAVDAALGDRPRRRAMFLTAYAGRIFGGTRGTSYGDVLAAAGVVDAAAADYTGWPQYSSEELLRIDPDLIVTKARTPGELCRMPGLERLKACRTPGAFIEVDGDLIEDAGPAMLDAAEAIFAAAYPDVQ